MAKSRGRIRSALRRYRAGVALVLGWAAAVPVAGALFATHQWVQNAIYRVFSGFPALAIGVDHLVDALANDASGSYALTLFVATIALPLGVLGRMVARSRVRAGHADPLDRARRFVSEHPRWTRVRGASCSTCWSQRSSSTAASPARSVSCSSAPTWPLAPRSTSRAWTPGHARSSPAST
jgi:hypothetical protein